MKLFDTKKAFDGHRWFSIPGVVVGLFDKENGRNEKRGLYLYLGPSVFYKRWVGHESG